MAEFNIINSGYLDFKTKNQYKKVFNSIYKNLRSSYKLDYNGLEHSSLINELASSIKLGKTEESLGNLKLLMEAYSNDLNNKDIKTPKDILDTLNNIIVEKPSYVIIA